MNRTPHIIAISAALFIVSGCATTNDSQDESASGGQTAVPYFTGDGGKGMSLGIIVPDSEGLGADQAYLPAMVQGVLVSNISRYSSISVLDRVSLDKVIAETLDPTYADNLDIVRLGHVAQVGHMMTGKIIRTSTGYTLQINVTDTTPNARTVASYSGNCTVAQLDEHTAVQTAARELLDEQDRVISRKSFRADGWWEYTYKGNAPTGVKISDDVRSTVSFTVKADDISDRLTIRIARVNGMDAETAARNGVLQVRAISKAEFDQNDTNNRRFNFVLGEIKGRGSDFKFEREVTGSGLSEVTRSLISIPPSIWGDPVVAIADKAFYRKASSDSAFVSIYLPDSVSSVGERGLFI